MKPGPDRGIQLKAGLIGRPLKRSLSPRLFELFSAAPGEKYSYTLLETGASGIEHALTAIKRAGWAGFNVTLPLKEKILPFLDALSPEAGAIGAVNAVRIKNGKMKGFNTDAAALKLALSEAGCRLRGRTCVIWGAGGAARAAAWVLGRGGADPVYIHNRTPSRAAALVNHFSKLFPRSGFSARKFTAVPAGTATLFINATPLGMYAPRAAALKFSGPPGSFYLDLAYTRGTSPFLKGRDGTAIPGLDLLIYQALKSAELFGGRPIKAAKIGGTPSRKFTRRRAPLKRFPLRLRHTVPCYGTYASIVELKDRFKAKLLPGK